MAASAEVASAGFMAALAEAASAGSTVASIAASGAALASAPLLVGVGGVGVGPAGVGRAGAGRAGVGRVAAGARPLHTLAGGASRRPRATTHALRGSPASPVRMFAPWTTLFPPAAGATACPMSARMFPVERIDTE